MPNSPSAKKALRKSQKRRLENRSKRSTLRTEIKKARTALGDEGAAADATAAAVKAAMRKLDKSAGKGLIHKNKAARLKGQLARHLNASTAAETAPAAG